MNTTDTNTLQLTTQQLEYLVAACEAPTWKNAATTLGVSLPALSQGLTELEKRVGIELFETQGRRKHLSPQAEEIYTYAKRVVTQTRDLSTWIKSMHQGEEGRLHVGMIDVAAVKHYPIQLKHFKHQRPNIDLHISVAPSGALFSHLREGKISLAITVAPLQEATDLTITSLLEEEMAVYAPPKTSKNATWGPWVGFPHGSHTRALTARALQKLQKDYEVINDSHQPEVLKEMVNLGMGWTVLPVSQAENNKNPLQRMMKKPLFTRTLVAVQRKNTPPNPLVKAFLQTLTGR